MSLMMSQRRSFLKMSWIWSALTPHPPIIVPEVGQGGESGAAATVEGLQRLTEALRKPDVLLLLSPHQPYAPGALFVNSARRLHGSFAPFGAPSVVLAPGSAQPEALVKHLAGAGVTVRLDGSPDLTPDQGSLVPLYFLDRAWGGLPPVVLASPIGLDPDGALETGRALADFDDGRRWALLASGDLSHRLKPGAPAGYAPEGCAFDAAVVQALKSAAPDPLLDLTPDFTARAGECGLRSVMTMLGLVGALGGDIEVLSYEGPFGVGYCNALWRAPEAPGRAVPDKAPARAGDGAGLPPCVRLARETVVRLLRGLPLPESGEEVAPSPLWRERRACFVSIKKRNGALRGCIGTLSPSSPSLDREIIANAVLASTRDPRFPPMTEEELEDAVFSVDVLSEPEPADGIAQLDPKVFGVIVSKGGRRGVLLPDLEGVDTAEEQVAIAARKAGIRDLEGVSLERFRVERHGGG